MKVKKMLTANIGGIDLDIEGWYTPPEPRDYYYPGAPSEFDIISVYLEGVDIYPLLFEIDCAELIEEEINIREWENEE